MYGSEEEAYRIPSLDSKGREPKKTQGRQESETVHRDTKFQFPQIGQNDPLLPLDALPSDPSQQRHCEPDIRQALKNRRQIDLS